MMIYKQLQASKTEKDGIDADKDNRNFCNISQESKEYECPFCQLSPTSYILENEYAFVKLDIKPVTEGHSLIIPKRHFPDYFDIKQTERDAVHDLILIRRKLLLDGDASIEGFNIGINCGKIAGQTIFHCHFHLIPRRKGDTEILKDGLRGVIARKKTLGQ